MAGLAVDKFLALVWTFHALTASPPRILAYFRTKIFQHIKFSMSILHIVLNPVSYDSRVLKETGSILSAWPEIPLEIAALHEPGTAEEEDLGGRQVRRWRLSTRPLPRNLLSQLIKYGEWYLRVSRHYGEKPLKIIHCHDLEPLPVAVALKRKTGAKLIYDAHELETENFVESEKSAMSSIRQWLLRRQERRLIPHVDQIITVSPSICAWYQRRYPQKPVHLIRNIPAATGSAVSPVPLRAALGVPDDALLFLYLGGLTRWRGIEAILDAFSRTEVVHHVLFMGSGPLTESIEQAAKSCRRIHHRKPVPPAEVVTTAAGGDIGLCFIDDICLSKRFCLPNKLFECLLAGLPIIASNLPDQAELIKRYAAGWVITPTKENITRLLLEMDIDTARGVREGLSGRVADLRWENEAKTLLDIYQTELPALIAPVYGRAKKVGYPTF